MRPQGPLHRPLAERAVVGQLRCCICGVQKGSHDVFMRFDTDSLLRHHVNRVPLLLQYRLLKCFGSLKLHVQLIELIGGQYGRAFT